jgi:Retinal pigment epithelial membrane protein
VGPCAAYPGLHVAGPKAHRSAEPKNAFISCIFPRPERCVLLAAWRPHIICRKTGGIMSAPADRFLEGSFAPVKEEITAFDLPVTGQAPAGLNGRYLRNGPNPLGLDDLDYHWFLGPGPRAARHRRPGRQGHPHHRHPGPRRADDA